MPRRRVTSIACRLAAFCLTDLVGSKSVFANRQFLPLAFGNICRQRTSSKCVVVDAANL
jgi:hypothetical protein